MKFVEVVLPAGYRLRLTADVTSALLQTVVAVLALDRSTASIPTTRSAASRTCQRRGSPNPHEEIGLRKLVP
jgi:hypothetical protein